MSYEITHLQLYNVEPLSNDIKARAIIILDDSLRISNIQLSDTFGYWSVKYPDGVFPVGSNLLKQLDAAIIGKYLSTVGKKC